MNDELAEIRISHLEQRIDRLVQELAQGKQGDNVQNAQLQPFVPIPRITGEDQKPFDIETDDDDAKSVVRCIFYWGKEEVELADYSLDEIPATGNATLYLTRTISEGEPVYALTTDEPEDGDEDTAYYKIYDFTDGEVSCDYRATFLTLGISAKFVGDMEGSEVIDAANDQILVTGHPGEEDAQGQDSHSGILFLTVSGRTGQDGEKIPAKIIARIKDKEEDEDWGAKTMTVTDKDGNQQIIHFLGCDDVDIDLSGSGGGGGGAENVIGSDYIKVEDEEEEDDDGNVTTKRKVSAKIQTSDPNPSSPVEHALLTHDTDQLVRSKKTFLGSSPLANSKKVIVDGPNGRVEVKNATGNKTIKLDADDIPGDCGGELKVHKLKFKDEEGNEHTYHGLFCADIDLTKEGKLIKSTTVTASAAPNGMNTIKFIYTDGTYDEFKVMNGMNGSPGSPGKDGDTPEITAERQGNHVYIYADGDLIATIEDGQTPEITAQRTGTKQTTIYANGIAIAVINDGEDGQGGSGGEPVEQTFISDISFSVSNGKIIANVTKKKGKFIEVTDAGTENIDVAAGTELDVVTDSGYSTPNLTITRKKVTVINIGAQSSKTVFTATPLSQG